MKDMEETIRIVSQMSFKKYKRKLRQNSVEDVMKLVTAIVEGKVRLPCLNFELITNAVLISAIYIDKFNMSHAAKRLGLRRTTFAHKRKKLEEQGFLISKYTKRQKLKVSKKSPDKI